MTGDIRTAKGRLSGGLILFLSLKPNMTLEDVPWELEMLSKEVVHRQHASFLFKLMFCTVSYYKRPGILDF